MCNCVCMCACHLQVEVCAVNSGSPLGLNLPRKNSMIRLTVST